MRPILVVAGLIALAVPALAQAPLGSVVPYSFGDDGGVVLNPASPALLNVGYAKVTPTAGAPLPALAEILGFRANGVLVAETVTTTAPLLTSGRLYVKLGGGVSTGAVFTNPNNQAASISYAFTAQDGSSQGSGIFNINANAQLSSFFDSAPYSGAPAAGTLTFTSTVPVSVAGVRTFLNERSELLFMLLPATPLPFTSNATIIVPHWADGTGYSDRVILINPTSLSITGTLEFLLDTGSPASLTVNGVAGTSFPYTIPAQASAEFVTSNGASVKTGAIRVTPTGGSNSPLVSSILSYKPSTITQSEMYLAGSVGGGAFRMYVENTVNTFGGILVANPSASAVSATVTARSLSGVLQGTSTVSIPGFGHLAQFSSQVFPSLPVNFQGILRVTAPGSGIVASGIRFRFNERNESLFSGVPAVPEGGSADTILPYVLTGGGYSSQVVMFSQASGQQNAGTLSFFSQGGAPLAIMDMTPPTVSITGPTGGSTISGSTIVTANATDDTGVAGVQFLLDGLPLGAEDTSAPYSVTWNTTGGTDGTHTLSAVARDAAGNQTTSNPVFVTVGNSGALRRTRAQITSQ